MKLWIVGKVCRDNDKDWEFEGVFDSEEKALEICTTELHFVGPAYLNQDLSHFNAEYWPFGYFPIITAK